MMPVMRMTAAVKRGELARQAGCNIETIRYYEKIGLLNAPSRTEGGHRLYSHDDQVRLQFILRARELGFTIEELRNLLSLVDTHDYTCGEVYQMTQRHLANIQRKIADLRRLQVRLKDISSKCEGGNTPECPIIDTLFS